MTTALRYRSLLAPLCQVTCCPLSRACPSSTSFWHFHGILIYTASDSCTKLSLLTISSLTAKPNHQSTNSTCPPSPSRECLGTRDPAHHKRIRIKIRLMRQGRHSNLEIIYLGPKYPTHQGVQWRATVTCERNVRRKG